MSNSYNSVGGVDGLLMKQDVFFVHSSFRNLFWAILYLSRRINAQVFFLSARSSELFSIQKIPYESRLTYYICLALQTIYSAKRNSR